MKTTFSKPQFKRRICVSELLRQTFSEQELAILLEEPAFLRTFDVAEQIESLVADLDSRSR